MRDPFDHWALVAVGRLLPRSIRLLVFEPLCAELLRNFQLGDRTPWARVLLVARITRALIESIFFALPRYLRAPGNTSRHRRWALLVAGSVFGLLLVLLVPWFAEVVKAGIDP